MTQAAHHDRADMTAASTATGSKDQAAAGHAVGAVETLEVILGQRAKRAA